MCDHRRDSDHIPGWKQIVALRTAVMSARREGFNMMLSAVLGFRLVVV